MDDHSADSFTLRARGDGGGTPTLNAWGANSDYGTLKSVLLGPIENYRWLETSSVSKKTLRRGVPFDGFWPRLRNQVRSFADLTPELVGAVEQLIDFVADAE